MTRKVKKEEFRKYNVGGFCVGDEVIYNGNNHTIEALDLKADAGYHILLDDASSSGEEDVSGFEDDKFDIIYRAKALKKKYNLWVSTATISHVNTPSSIRSRNYFLSIDNQTIENNEPIKKYDVARKDGGAFIDSPDIEDSTNENRLIMSDNPTHRVLFFNKRCLSHIVSMIEEINKIIESQELDDCFQEEVVNSIRNIMTGDMEDFLNNIYKYGIIDAYNSSTDTVKVFVRIRD